MANSNLELCLKLMPCEIRKGNKVYNPCISKKTDGVDDILVVSYERRTKDGIVDTLISREEKMENSGSLKTLRSLLHDALRGEYTVTEQISKIA